MCCRLLAPLHVFLINFGQDFPPFITGTETVWLYGMFLLHIICMFMMLKRSPFLNSVPGYLF